MINKEAFCQYLEEDINPEELTEVLDDVMYQLSLTCAAGMNEDDVPCSIDMERAIVEIKRLRDVVRKSGRRKCA